MYPQPLAPTQQQFLSFALSQSHWALISTTQLTEITPVEAHSITRIPGMPSAVMGVCPWQGEILWIIDLRQWSQPSSQTEALSIPTQGHILKIKSHWGDLGYFIHKVGKLMTIDPLMIQAVNGSQTPHFSQFRVPDSCLQGIWTTPQGYPLPILDGEAIAAQIRDSL